MYTIILNMYTDVKSCITYNYCKSDYFNCEISDVSVSLSEKLVSPPTSMYPYRAYIETLLSYRPAAKESQLTGVMWYKDTPGQQDKRTKENKGFTSRKELTTLSKSVQMMGKLYLDLFCQDKYLLNHVDLKIKLRRSRDAFALRPVARNDR